MNPFKFDGRRSQVAKAEVCKTSMQRFESARRLQSLGAAGGSAGVAELGDAVPLKGTGPARAVGVRFPPSAPESCSALKLGRLTRWKP